MNANSNKTLNNYDLSSFASVHSRFARNYAPQAVLGEEIDTGLFKVSFSEIPKPPAKPTNTTNTGNTTKPTNNTANTTNNTGKRVLQVASKTAKVELGDCDTELRKKHSILYLLVDEYKSTHLETEFSNTVEYTVYDKDRKPINIQTLCASKDKKVLISAESIPSAKERRSSIINMRQQSINIYDSSASFYNDVCQPFSFEGIDYTVEMRRNFLFPPTVVKCPSGCTFTEINTDFFAVCTCKSHTPVYLRAVSASPFADSATSFSYSIVNCYKEVIDNIWTNTGFYLYLGIISVWLLIQSLFYLLNFNESLIRNLLRLKKYNARNFDFNCLDLVLPNVSIRKNFVLVERNAPANTGEELGSFESSRSLNTSERLKKNKQEIEEDGIALTNLDLRQVSAVKALAFDKRGYFAFVWADIANRNILLQPFASFSLADPYFISLQRIFFVCTALLFFNCFFMFDIYLYDRVESNQVKVSF